MVRVEMLRELMNERLTAVVEEICELFVSTIAEYEERLSRSNVEPEQQPELLTPVLSDGGNTLYPEIQRVFVIKEEQQQGSFSLDQNTTEPFYIKKEAVEPGSVLEGQCPEQPHYPSTDTQQVMSPNQAPAEQEQRPTQKDNKPTPPHRDEDQETPCTLRKDSPAPAGCRLGQEREAERDDEHRNSVCPSSSSAQQMEVHEHCDGAALKSGGANTSSDCETEDSDDDWYRTPAQQSHLKLMKNTEVPESEPVKKLVSNCGLKSGNNLQAATELQPDSSEPDTEDSDDEDWNCSRKLQSGLTSVKPTEVPEMSSQSSSQTSFSSSIPGKGFQVKQQVEKGTTCLLEATLTESKRGKRSSHAAKLSEPPKPKRLSNSSASKKCNSGTSLKRRKTEKMEEKMEEKSLQCSVCDEIFKKKTYWVLHMKMHKARRDHKTTHPGGKA